MDEQDGAVKKLSAIFSTAAENKIYGSVEIFFEDGKITQITQRVINKISSPGRKHT